MESGEWGASFDSRLCNVSKTITARNILEVQSS
jgi:hypothetical protein